MTTLSIAAATGPFDILRQLGQIFYFIVLPILLLAGIGWVLQRSFQMDMRTLTRLNFYFVMPPLAFCAIVESPVSLGEIGKVMLFGMLMIFAMGALAWLVALARGIPKDRRSAMMMTAMFYNSGNYGLPLQKLALGAPAETLQMFVMLTQNIINFTIGVWLAATGRRNLHWKPTLLKIAKFPPIYAFTAGFVVRGIADLLGDRAGAVARALEPFWQTFLYVRNAFYAIALCTLGAQLAMLRRQMHRYPVKTSVLLRLVAAPTVGLALVRLLGITGFEAQVLFISAAMPTALNVMLLCLEFDNHPDYAARTVFYSTLISPISVTLVVFLAKSGWIF